MNLHIASNSKSTGLQNNFTNDFTMKIAQPIDALNKDCYLEILQVCYPQTTKNIVGEECFFSLEIFYDGFIPSKLPKYDGNRYIFISDKFIIPEGIYDLFSLIIFLNNILEGFEIFFAIGSNGKIMINVNVNIEYWVDEYSSKTAKSTIDGGNVNEFRISNKPTYEKNKVQHASFNQTIRIVFSKKLAFMLGLINEKILDLVPLVFEIIKDTVTPKLFFSKYFDYLPDVSDGLNKMFIYCDEIELGLVGDSSAELLTTVPIQWSQDGMANGQLVNYSPPKSLRKFKKAIVNQIHIQVKDTTGKLVSFDSGTLSIDCLVHS